MNPDDAAARARSVYEAEWPTIGDATCVVIGKGEMIWVLSAPAHPAQIVDRILDDPDPRLPDGPWDSVAAVGTAYVETHDDLDVAISRAGQLEQNPTDRTWHTLAVYARTAEGAVAVTWRSTIDGDSHSIEDTPLTIADCGHGAIADSVDRLARVGLILR